MADWSLPVRLEYATAQEFASGAASFTGTFVQAKVQNIEFEKTVNLHYRQFSDWSVAQLDWAANYGNYDVFTIAAPYTNEFALSYSVAGSTYWDNNSFRNYHVPNFNSAIGGRVMLRRARIAAFSSFQGNVSGTLYVENLSFNKSVGIRLLPEGQASWHDIGAQYVGVAREASVVALGPVEQWDFGSPTFNVQRFSLAAYYNNLDSGEWYWDNNFGQNYSIGSARPEID
jgi:hypothetical protein